MINVKEMYTELLKQGLSPKDAAKQIQTKTGLSAVTGRPVRQNQLKFKKKDGSPYGQY